jgi:hypothetical protein
VLPSFSLVETDHLFRDVYYIIIIIIIALMMEAVGISETSVNILQDYKAQHSRRQSSSSAASFNVK